MSLTFFNMKVTDLVGYIQKYLLPTDVLYFQKVLSSNLVFKIHPSFVPSSTNFPVFYRALLLYGKKYSFLFSFLSDNNAAKNIPACDNKPGGLIFIFASKIPFDYGTAVVKSFGSRKFDNISKFMDDFFDVAAEHHETSLKAREMVQYLSSRTPTKSPETNPTHNRNRLHAFGFGFDMCEDEMNPEVSVSETYLEEQSVQ
jgi:hypothetical protein